MVANILQLHIDFSFPKYAVHNLLFHLKTEKKSNKNKSFLFLEFVKKNEEFHFYFAGMKMQSRFYFPK